MSVYPGYEVRGTARCLRCYRWIGLEPCWIAGTGHLCRTCAPDQEAAERLARERAGKE